MSVWLCCLSSSFELCLSVGKWIFYSKWIQCGVLCTQNRTQPTLSTVVLNESRCTSEPAMWVKIIQRLPYRAILSQKEKSVALFDSIGCRNELYWWSTGNSRRACRIKLCDGIMNLEQHTRDMLRCNCIGSGNYWVSKCTCNLSSWMTQNSVVFGIKHITFSHAERSEALRRNDNVFQVNADVYDVPFHSTYADF